MVRNIINGSPFTVGGWFGQTKMMQKSWENDWDPSTWLLIWEYSATAIQCIPTWQGLDGFKKSYVLWKKVASAFEGLRALEILLELVFETNQ